MEGNDMLESFSFGLEESLCLTLSTTYFCNYCPSHRSVSFSLTQLQYWWRTKPDTTQHLTMRLMKRGNTGNLIRKARTRKSIRVVIRNADKNLGLLGGDCACTSIAAWRSPSRLLLVYPDKTPMLPVLIYRSNAHRVQDG